MDCADSRDPVWASADKLCAQRDAAEYKHQVLGLIFLKYIFDTFVEQRQKAESAGDGEQPRVRLLLGR